jgi:hypothetical protein
MCRNTTIATMGIAVILSGLVGSTGAMPSTPGMPVVQTTWCRDLDADTYGDASNTIDSPTQPDGYVADCSDCNDFDPSVNPGMSDANCDGVDNDCNAFVDDGFGPCTVGTGQCQVTGTYTCVEGEPVCDAQAGNPSVEVCDGLDNDCDGVVDNGCTVNIEQVQWTLLKILFR